MNDDVDYDLSLFKAEDITLDLILDLRSIQGFDALGDLAEQINREGREDLAEALIAKYKEYCEKEHWNIVLGDD